MDLIKFEILLDFSKKSKVVTPALSVFRELTGRDITEAGRPREPGVRIRSGKEKSVVVWDYGSCAILHEDISSHNDCIQKIIKVLDKINGVAPIPTLSSRAVQLHWILPAKKYDFKSLESKYRENFIKQSVIFDNCFDSSVIIEMKRGKLTLDHQSGAMDTKQLQEEYKTFKIRRGHPKLFLFLETTVNSNETVEYSSERTRDFLFRSYEICKSHSDAFQGLMEGVL